MKKAMMRMLRLLLGLLLAFALAFSGTASLWAEAAGAAPAGDLQDESVAPYAAEAEESEAAPKGQPGGEASSAEDEAEATPEPPAAGALAAPAATGTDISPQAGAAPNTGLGYIPGEVLVVFEPQVSERQAENIASSIEGDVVGDVAPLQDEVVLRVELPEGQSVEEAVAEYEAEPGVLYAQPNYMTFIEESTGGEGLPSDPMVGSTQWYLDKIGVGEAWDVIAGMPGREKVRVAVLDTTVQLNHPDLAANVNTALSRDFAHPEDVTSHVFDSRDSHGTHVAGIVGAVSGNGIGVAGVAAAPGAGNSSIVELMLLNVFRDVVNNGVLERTAASDSLAAAIDYAVANGAKVINMSLGANIPLSQKPSNDIVEAAMQRARDAGVLIIASAGNEGINDAGAINEYGNLANQSFHYPSDYDTAMSIIWLNNAEYRTGVNPRNTRSNYGNYKDLSAPGSNMGSTLPGSTYGQMQGTSMASPVVAGVAALVYYGQPGATAQQVQACLQGTAIDLHSMGWDTATGHGCVNAAAAVRQAAEGSELSNLRARLVAEGTAEITLSADLDISSPLVVNGSKTLKSSGGATLRRGAGFTGNMFSVSKSASLTLENITVDGGAPTQTADGALVFVHPEGKLTLSAGGILQNNHRSGDGGAVHNQGSFILDGGIVRNNRASGNGGGIFSQYIAIYNSEFDYYDSTVTFNGGQVTGNAAGKDGGGYYAPAARAITTIKGGSFVGNSAGPGYLGGEVYLGAGYAKDPDYGGVIYSRSSISISSGGSLQIGQPGGKAGLYLSLGNAGIMLSAPANANIHMNIELGNERTPTPYGEDRTIHSGVGLYNLFSGYGVDSSVVLGWLELVDRDDCELRATYWRGGGQPPVQPWTAPGFPVIQAFYKPTSSVSTLAALKTALAASGTGLISLAGNITVTETLAVNGVKYLSAAMGSASTNYSLLRGAGFTGSLLNVSASARLSLNRITLDGVDTQAAGPLVDNKGTLITSASTLLQNNTSSGSGGALANSGEAELRGQIIGNTAALGGGIYNTGAIIAPNSLTLSGNSATDGGGIYNAGELSVTGELTDTEIELEVRDNVITITQNTAAARGGGIYNASGGTLAAPIITATRNTAANGGALYNAGAAILLGGNFGGTRNSATGNGADIYTAASLTVGGKLGVGSGSGTTAGGLFLASGAVLNISTAVPLNNSKIYLETKGRTLPFDVSSPVANPDMLEANLRQSNYLAVADDATAWLTVKNGKVIAEVKPDQNVYTFAALKAALETPPSPVYNPPIIVGANIALTGGIVVNGEKTITTASSSAKFTLTRGVGYGGALITVPADAVLNMTNLHMDGAAAPQAADVLLDVQAGGALSYRTANLLNNAGGALRNAGEATLTTVTAENNGTEDGAVGGIANLAGASLTISAGKLNGNQAANGAALNNAGAVTLSGSSSMTGNRAGGYGGALYNQSGASIRGTSGSTVFSGNSAAQGGGIYNAGDFTLRSPTVVGNTVPAGAFGAGVYQKSGSLKFTYTPVIGGVYNGVKDPQQNGVYLENGNLLAVESLTGASCAIGIETGGRAIPFDVTEAMTNGSAMAAFFRVQDRPGHAVEHDATTQRLVVRQQGETVASDFETLKTALAAGGSKVIVLAADVTVSEQLTVNGDKLLKTGGAARTLRRGEAFTGNLLAPAAYASLAMENIIVNGGGQADQSSLIRIASNAAAQLGGGVVLQNNKASTYGGAVYVDGGSLMLNGAKITNCQANNGGAVYITGSNASATLSGGEITNCTAAANGGAIYASNASLHITGGAISGCQANGGNGGAIYMSGSSASVTFASGEITNCIAASSGGAIYASSATLNITGGAISGCQAAAGSGGAVYAPSAKFTLTGGTITGNTLGGTSSSYYASGVYAGNITLGGAPKLGTSNGDNELVFASTSYIATINPALPLAGGARINVNVRTASNMPMKVAKMSDGSSVQGQLQYFHTSRENAIFEEVDGVVVLMIDPGTKTYTVSFRGNSGRGIGANDGKTTITVEYRGGRSYTLPTVAELFSRKDYIPKSTGEWNTSSGGGGTAYNGGASYTPTGNLTLYAQWTAAGKTTATGFSLFPDTTSLAPGERAVILAEATPADAQLTLGDITSSNTKVLKVIKPASGQLSFSVEAVAAGTATITVNAKSGSKTLSKQTKAFTVKDKLTGITVNLTRVSLAPGLQKQLRVGTLPAGLAMGEVTWASSDSGVAEVADGTITAKGYGEATITASMQNPEGEEVFTAETIVTVEAVITELTLVSDGLGDNETLLPGQKRTLTATVLPAEADQAVTWQVTNPAVLRIPATATDAPTLTVIAELPGTASVYATAADGRTKVLHFTVAKPRGSVAFADGWQTLALREGDEPLDVKIKADAGLQLALGGFEDGTALPGSELTFENNMLSASLASAPPENGEWTLTLTPRSASAQSVDLIVYCPLNPDISARLRVSVHAAPPAPGAVYQTPHAETQAITVYTQSDAPARLGLWFTGSGAPIGLRALTGPNGLPDPDYIGFAAANPKKAADVKAAEELAAKFDIAVLDDNTLGFAAKPGESYASKYKARLVITPPGAEPMETAEIITVQVSSKAPTLKAAAIKLNSFYNDNAQPIVISGGEVTSLRVDTAKTPAALLSWLDISGIDAHGQDGTVRMRTGSEIPKKNSSRKLYLIAKLDGWGEKEFAFTVSVSSASTPPSVKLKSTTAKLYAGYGGAGGEAVYSTGAALVLMPKTKTAALADMRFTKASVVSESAVNLKTYKNQTLYEVADDAIDPATGAFTLRLTDETAAPKAGKVLLAFEVDGQEAQSIQLAVNVQVVKMNTRIGLKASKSTITLNPSLNGGAGEDYTVAITPSVADFDMADFELSEPQVYSSNGKTLLAEHDLVLQVEGFKLHIGLKPNAAPQKTYKVKLTVPGLNRHMTGNKDATLTLTVKTGKVQAATVKAAVSGKVDLTRSTPATLNFTFSQYLGAVSQVTDMILLEKNKVTEIANEGDAFYLTRKGPSSFAVNVDPDNAWVKPGTYYLKLSVRLETGEVIAAAPAKLVVTAAKPKVTRSPSAITLYKGNPGGAAEFTVSLPDNCFAVREIRVRGAAAEIYEVRRLYGNHFTLSIKNIDKAKNTTLTLELYLHGNQAAATTHAMKITVR